MKFADFGLSPDLISVLKSQGISSPTKIQCKLIPTIAEGRDVLATAKTGSGKSLAYALPLVNSRIARLKTPSDYVLIVVPTRELVAQLGGLIRLLTSQTKHTKIVELTGGGSINPQLMNLRGGADFVIATPGRLLDVVSKNALDLSKVSTLVLDEADRLLDTGFQDETNEILDQLPNCQRLLLSATLSKKVNAKAKWLLTSPLVLDLSETVAELIHRVIQVDRDKRELLLAFMLKDLHSFPALVFAGDRQTVEQLTKVLSKQGFEARALHGKLTMAQRTNVMNQLRDGRLEVLLATDLVARGIDIPRLPLVINYDLPRSPEIYTHRVGRSGRAGESGLAVSFVDINDESHFSLIEKRVGMTLGREIVDGFSPVNVLTRQSLTDGNGGIKGKRMSKKDKLRAAADKNG
ncbi:MAG: DEAD/DEAH box helicase [Granulosicoccus sp.]